VLKPQPFKKPTAMPDPVPTRAGKVMRLAAMRSPPFPPLSFNAGLLKANLNCSSFGRRVNRSAAVSARNSCWVRLGPVDASGAGATVVVGAGSGLVGAATAT